MTEGKIVTDFYKQRFSTSLIIRGPCRRCGKGIHHRDRRSIIESGPWSFKQLSGTNDESGLAITPFREAVMSQVAPRVQQGTAIMNISFGAPPSPPIGSISMPTGGRTIRATTYIVSRSTTTPSTTATSPVRRCRGMRWPPAWTRPWPSSTPGQKNAACRGTVPDTGGADPGQWHAPRVIGVRPQFPPELLVIAEGVVIGVHPQKPIN